MRSVQSLASIPNGIGEEFTYKNNSATGFALNLGFAGAEPQLPTNLLKAQKAQQMRVGAQLANEVRGIRCT